MVDLHYILYEWRKEKIRMEDLGQSNANHARLYLGRLLQKLLLLP